LIPLRLFNTYLSHNSKNFNLRQRTWINFKLITKEGGVTIATIENTEGCAVISRYLRWRGVLWPFGIAREAYLSGGAVTLQHPEWCIPGRAEPGLKNRERKRRERRREIDRERESSQQSEHVSQGRGLRADSVVGVYGDVRSCGHASSSCVTRVHTPHVDRAEINDNRGETRGIHVALSGNRKSG